MSYQVTLNSRNVLVPIALEDRHGDRMTGPLARLDTATAMMIQVAAGGGFTQEFFPLRIGQDITAAYSGSEWELWVQKTGSGLHSYYLGIPDAFFADDGSGKAERSLSVQVVGTSPLTGRDDFSGGVDVSLQAQVEPPLIPGFLNLSERFFPTLLPHNFIERGALEVFEFQGKRQLVLMAALQMDPSDRIPVSLEKHWEPKSWVNAVVENLAPSGYFAIRGGCFYARNRKITHWFGGSIGLEERSFRKAATEKILAMGPSGNGSWVFWLDPQGMPALDLDALVKDFSGAGNAHLSIRHPMMHRLLSSKGGLNPMPLQDQPSIAHLPAVEALSALTQVARVLGSHQGLLQHAQAEPAHAIWSQVANPSKAAMEAFSGHVPDARAEQPRLKAQAGLEADIRSLYQSHGETLRALEALFDETYGYSAWDAVGNPLRETVTGFLTETAEGRSAQGREAKV